MESGRCSEGTNLLCSKFRFGPCFRLEVIRAAYPDSEDLGSRKAKLGGRYAQQLFLRIEEA